MTDKDDLEELKAAAATAFAEPFGGVLLLAPEEGRGVWIDGRAAPPEIKASAPKDEPAHCAWRGARESLLRVLESERAFESAFLSGRVSISGDMSIMARLRLKGTR